MKQVDFEAALWLLVVNRMIAIHKSETPAGNSVEDQAVALQAAMAEVAHVNAEISVLLDRYLKGLDEGVWKTRNDALNDRKAHAQGEIQRIKSETEHRNEQRTTQDSVAVRAALLLRSTDGWKVSSLSAGASAIDMAERASRSGSGQKDPI